MTQIIPLTKIGFFNPGRLTDEEIEQSFVARVSFYEFIFKKIISEKPSSIPQHHLIIGQRGMGKTSLLIRIAAELRKTPYKNSFIPLSFPEEQYNVDRLSKFWLNCLDALADALDKEHQTEFLKGLDTEISNLSKERALDANAVYETFKKWISKVNRRPVLLVDNLNLILSKINKEDQHQVRAILMSEAAPILVGASATTIEETVDYGAPFYDAFQINYLKKLSFQESLDILLNLAKITGMPDFANHLYSKKGRVEALYELTGGTPRTLAILFPLIQNGFSDAIQTDLDALLDIVTPLYKARFEELAQQLQIVLDAVALHWNPINLEQLREITLLENQQLSPQLKRLADVGWLQKLDAYEAKGGAYELSERFFNIWYLMRRSSRRQKRELYCLTKFLESFYGNDLHEIAKGRLGYKTGTANGIALDLALADAVNENELKEKLRIKSYDTIIELGLIDGNILKDFSLPTDYKNRKIEKLLNDVAKQIENKKYEEAKITLESIVKLDEANKDAWFYLAYIYHSYFDSYDKAVEAYEKAIAIDGKDAQLQNNLGNVFLEIKQYQKAEQALKKATSLNSKLAEPFSSLGRLYKDIGRYQEAENNFKKAIKLNDKFTHPWIGLGNLYKILERYDEAEKAFRKALQIDKSQIVALINLGNLFAQNLKKYENAEDAYKKAIKINENSIDSWVQLGVLYMSLGRMQEAEPAFKKVITLNDKLSYPWNNLGSLYASTERYAEAEQVYKKAIDLDEKYASPWYNLGNLYRDLSRHPEAEQAYKKAIELNERYASAWYNLGNLYRDLNRHSEAEQAYKKAIELNEKDVSAWNSLGSLYHDYLYNYKEAEKAYLKAIEIKPNLDYLKYNLVFLWRDKMDMLKEANEMFQTITRVDEFKDSYLLNEALFAYYDKNIGIAESFLEDALLTIGDTLPSHTADDWYRSAAVIIKLGFANSLLKVFFENGYDTIFRPFYVAIEAIAKKDDLYFNSIAAEVREPAKKIMERILAYMK